MSRLRLRLLGSVLLGSVTSGFVGLVTVNLGIRAYTELRLRDPVARLEPAELARCRAHPESWQRSLGLHTAWPYRASGRSDHALAPELAPALVPPEPGGRVDLGTRAPQFYARGAVYRVAENGPCAVIWVRAPGRPPSLDQLRLLALGAVLLSAVLGLLVASLAMVRPLVRRVEALDAAAARVNTAAYAVLDDPTDDELGHVAQTLDRSHARIARDTAELAVRSAVLERHLAAVAHDLRTPLASLQLALEGLHAAVPERSRGELRGAQLEVGTLEALADNLLQASRLQAGLAVCSEEARVELRSVTERVAARFAILGRARGVEVVAAVPDQPLPVCCEPSLAERVLANLVHNALLHGKPEHPVGIVLDRVGEGFRWEVHSAGPTLPASQLAALAARRLTAPAPARSRGQDGLGLAIVNEVAERAGWQLVYEAADTGGLVVRIVGPLA